MTRFRLSAHEKKRSLLISGLVALPLIVIVVLGGTTEQITSTAEIWNLRPHTKPVAAVAAPAFKAKFEETTTTNGNTVVGLRGLFYRDRLGSSRTEFLGRKDLEEVVVIDVPTRGSWYVLHLAPQVGLQMKRDVPSNTNEEWAFPGGGATEVGREAIEGIECRHFRTPPANDGSVEDVWISDVHHAVLQESRHSAVGVTTWKLLDIQFADQPASLFEPPSGFTVLQGDAPAGK